MLNLSILVPDHDDDYVLAPTFFFYKRYYINNRKGELQIEGKIYIFGQVRTNNAQDNSKSSSFKASAH